MSQVTNDVEGDWAQPLREGMGRHKSRGEQLAESIRAAIRRRGMNEGDFFGTLESIREETGLARTTVSDAVSLLRDRGVLVVKPGRKGGLFVAKSTPIVRLRHTLMHFDDNPASAADAIELRDSLESLIALSAARHRTQADVTELEEILGRLRDADTWDAFMHVNWALHSRIAAICPNAMARAVYESTLGFLSGGHAEQDDEVDAGYRAERQAVHEQLVAAIASGDADATSRALAAHGS